MGHAWFMRRDPSEEGSVSCVYQFWFLLRKGGNYCLKKTMGMESSSGILSAEPFYLLGFSLFLGLADPRNMELPILFDLSFSF